MLSARQKPFFDLLTPEALLEPYGLYKQMRETEPVYYSEENDFWVLTRYRDIELALRDPRLSSNRSSLFARQLGDLDLGMIQNFLELFGNTMIEKDPPEYTPIRKTANHGFKARALQGWRAVIQNTTDRLLDKVLDRHRMDVVPDISVPLPAFIIAEIFGVPEEERMNLLEWSPATAALWGAPAGNIEAVARRADASAAAFLKLIRRIIAERRQERGTDMISLLITAYEENGLSLQQLPSLCIEILNGGFLTATDIIPNGIHALLSHPDQWQLLKGHQDQPAAIQSAVEEILRYDSSAQFIFRIAKENLTIGGKEMPAGSVVALALGAANHDPEKFESPETFDVMRSPNDHLGLGRGNHFCIGAALGRMELEILFATLLRRMPDLRLDPDRPAVRKHKSIVFKGFETLPVLF